MMKAFLKFLLWFLLLIPRNFISIAGNLTSIPALESSEASNSTSSEKILKIVDVLPHNLHSSEEEIAILALSNGTLHCLERNSRKPLWSFQLGSPVCSIDQAISDVNKKEKTYPLHKALVSNSYDNFIIDIRDGYMQQEDFGTVNLMKRIEEFVASAPHYSGNEVMLGAKQTFVYLLDAKNGSCVAELNSLALPSMSDENDSSRDPEDLMHLKIAKYSVHSFCKVSRKMLWTITVSDVRAALYHDGKEVAVSVYHVRDGYAIQFLLENLRLTPGDRELLHITSNSGSSINLSTAITGDDRSSTDLAIAYSNDAKESTSLVHPEILRNTLDENMKVASITFISFMALPLVCVILIIMMKRSATNESKAMTTSVPKRRKARKLGNLKKRAITEENDANVSSEEGTNLLKLGVMDDSGANGRTVGKLFISNVEIAKGSNGTVVLEGTCDGRQVAVKRLVRAHHDVAYKEIQNLIASDRHPNIVRLYGVESDSDFVYLSLERCTCSLNDLIQICSDSSQHSLFTENKSTDMIDEYNIHLALGKEILKDVELWKANCHPSSQLVKVMRDIVSGVAHLHDLGIIHRDLKPQNILINKERTLCAKLSDMGISKRLIGDNASLGHHPTGYGSSGWQAPEQLLHGRQTRAVDLFSLGCVLFFCITKGKHPFGDHLERDMNIVKDQVDLFLVEHIPEAVDLLCHLLNPNPELRPSALNVMNHPFFWSPETRLSFLRDASDRVELEDRVTASDILNALENVAPMALGGKWDTKLETAFIANIGRYRRYDFGSMRDLLRVIRNKSNHFRELPMDIQEILGPLPEGFVNYFAIRFPRFLIEVYRVIYKFCKEEEWAGKYLNSSLV